MSSLALRQQFTSACRKYVSNGKRITSRDQLLSKTVEQDTAQFESILAGDPTLFILHVARDENNAKMVRELLTALMDANLALDQLHPGASSDAQQEHIETVEKRVRDARSRVHVLLTSLTKVADVDEIATMARAHRMACSALKSCFWETPFCITTDAANRAIGKMLPTSILRQLPGSVLSLLNYYKIPPSMRKDVEAIPCFRLLIDTSAHWTEAKQRADGTAEFILRQVLSNYVPVPVAITNRPKLRTSKLAELEIQYPKARENWLANLSGNSLKIGIFGMHQHGKSTWLNHLIGSDLLPTRRGKQGFSAGWPIVIRHDPKSTLHLTVPLSQFIPYLEVLEHVRAEDYQYIWQDPLVKQLWREYRFEPKRYQGKYLRFEANAVKNMLLSIGVIVRCYANLVKESRINPDLAFVQTIKRTPLSEDWPVLTVRMKAFENVEERVDLLDLPALNNSNLVKEDAKAQLRFCLQLCHANVYVCKADESLLDMEDFNLDLAYLRILAPDRKKPWALVVTHQDIHTGKMDLKESIESQIWRLGCSIGPFPRQGSVAICSVVAHRVFSDFLQELRKTKQVPSIREMRQSPEGKMILYMMEDHRHNWDEYVADWSLLETYSKNQLVLSGAEESVRIVQEELLPKARAGRVAGEALRISNEFVRSAHREYDSFLLNAYIEQDSLTTAKKRYQDHLHRATLFCSRFITKSLQSRTDTRLKINSILDTFRMELHQLLFEYLTNNRAIPLPKSGSLQETVRQLRELHQNCLFWMSDKSPVWWTTLETRVRAAANSAWTKYLEGALDLVTTKWVVNQGDTESEGIKTSLMVQIRSLMGESPSNVVSAFMDTEKANQDFWSACESSDSRAAYVADTSTTAPSPSISTTLRILEEWADVDGGVLREEHLRAMGFFVTPASPPPLPRSSRDLNLSKTLRFEEISEHLSAIINTWCDESVPRSQQTAGGALIVVMRKVISTTLDLFKQPIETIDQALKEKKQGGTIAGADLDEVILAEVNTICAGAALRQIISPRLFVEEKRTNAAISDMRAGANDSDDSYSHLITDNTWVV